MTGKGIRRRICWLFVNHLLPQGACFEARRKLLNWAGYPVGSRDTHCRHHARND